MKMGLVFGFWCFVTKKNQKNYVSMTYICSLFTDEDRELNNYPFLKNHLFYQGFVES